MRSFKKSKKKLNGKKSNFRLKGGLSGFVKDPTVPPPTLEDFNKLELEPTLNKKIVSDKFKQLSRIHHPDIIGNASTNETEEFYKQIVSAKLRIMNYRNRR